MIAHSSGRKSASSIPMMSASTLTAMVQLPLPTTSSPLTVRVVPSGTKVGTPFTDVHPPAT